jgi:hypothetical protein
MRVRRREWGWYDLHLLVVLVCLVRWMLSGAVVVWLWEVMLICVRDNSWVVGWLCPRHPVPGGLHFWAVSRVTPQLLLRVSTPGLPLFNPLSHEVLYGQSTSNFEFKVLTKCKLSWISCPSLSCTSKWGFFQNPKANPPWAIGTLIEAMIKRSCKPYDHGLDQI